MFSFKSYLLKAGNGTWYFRIGVPHDLRAILGKREIKRTLKTTDKKQAQQRAYIYASQCHDLFERQRLMSKKDKPIHPTPWATSNSYLDGNDELSDGSKAARNLRRLLQESRNRTTYTKDDVDALLAERLGPDDSVVEVTQKLRETRTKYSKDDVDALLAEVKAQYETEPEPIATPLPVTPSVAQPVVEPITEPIPQPVAAAAPITESIPNRPPDFNALFEAYIQYKYDEEEWNPRATTERDHRATFSGFLRITPNTDYTTFSRADAYTLRENLRKLPPNIGKNPKLMNLSVDQLKSMKHKKLLSHSAIKKYLNRLRSVFDFAISEGYVSHNPFKGISQKVTDSGNRLAYSPENLKIIFNTPTFTELKYKKAYKYWFPLLALYTGARLSELVQLSVSDVKTDKGILYLHITDDDPDQRVKTKAGKRTVPVHNDLLRFGFAEYVESLKAKKIDRLFHDITPYHDPTYNIIDWGKNAGREWNEKILPELGIKEDGLVFHSFRHTLITELKYKEVLLAKRQEIVGHESSQGAGKAYEKHFLVSQLKTEIDKVDFSEAVENVKPFK